jgi:hypothetical protein
MSEIQRTTVATEPSGELRVEISIGDNLDRDDAREGIRFAVVLPATDADRHLSSIQIRALNRARAVLGECIDALKPAPSA